MFEDKKNVHVSYVSKVSKDDTNVTEDVYYPLLEIVTISIAKSISTRIFMGQNTPSFKENSHRSHFKKKRNNHF